MPNKFVITAALQIQPPPAANVAGVVKFINQQLKGVNINVGVNTQVAQQTQRQVAQIKKEVASVGTNAREASNDLRRFGEYAAQSLKRFAGFTIIATSFFALASAMRVSLNEAIDFQQSIVKVSQVTGTAIKDLAGLRGEISRLATTFGVNSRKLVDVAQILAQAGLSAEQTRVALEALAKTELSPTFDNIIDTTEGAIAIMNQFQIGTGELEEALGSLNSVAAKFAVESDDIIKAVRRTGGAFAASGGDLNDLLGLFTSVRQTTRESAETIATGFRTIFTRVQRPRTLNFLESLGISLRDLEGRFVGPFEAVRRLNSALSEIETTDPRFAQIVEELGGFRQVSKVIPLVQQFNVAERARIVAIQGSLSLTEDSTKAQQAFAVQIAKVREEFDLLIRNIVQDESFERLLQTVLSITSALIKLADALRAIIVPLSFIGAAAIGRGSTQVIAGLRSNLSTFLPRNKGGIIPGAGDTDTVPAVLTPGEFVLNKKAVRRIGVGNLRRLNDFGKPVQGFNRGGLVGFQQGGIVSPTQGFAVGALALTIVPQLLQTFAGLDKEVQNNIAGLQQFAAITTASIFALKAGQELSGGPRTKLGELQEQRTPLRQGANEAQKALDDVTKRRVEIDKQFNQANLQATKAINDLSREAPTLNRAIRNSRLNIITATKTLAQAEPQLQSLLEAQSNAISAREQALNEFRRRPSATSQQALAAANRQLNITTSQLATRGPGLRQSIQFARQDISRFTDLQRDSDRRLGDLQFEEQRSVGNRSVLRGQRQQISQEAAAAQKIADAKNKELAAINQQIAKQQQLVRFLDNFNIGLSIASAAAIAFGDILKSSAEANLRQGLSQSRTDFAVGGALSSAGQFGLGGAALGSLIAPGVGTAIGGTLGVIGGAIFGFATSIKEADRILSQVTFDRKVEDLRRVLTAVSEGSSDVTTSLGKFVTGVEALESGLFDADAVSKETRQGQISAATVDISSFLDKLAKSSSSFEDFQAKAGETVRIFGNFTRTPISELNERFRGLIRTTTEQTETARKLIEVQRRQFERLLELNLLSGALRDAVSSLSVFSSSVGEIEGFLSGATATSSVVDRSEILNRPGSVTNPAIFRNIIQQVASQFGGRGNQLATEAIQIQSVIQNLPGILQQATITPPFEGTGGFEDRLKRLLEDVPDFVVQSVLANAREVIGSEAKDENIINAIKQNAGQVAADLSKGVLDDVLKFFADNVTLLNQQTTALSELYSKRRAAELRLIDDLNNVIDLREQRAEFDASLGTRPVPIRTSLALDRQRQLNILGPRNAGLINRPEAIGAALQESQARILRLNLQLQTAEVAKRNDLLRTIDSEKTNVDRLRSALSFLTDVTSRNAALQKELDRRRSGREFRAGVAGDFVFGDAESRRTLGRTVAGVRAVAGGVSPTDLPASIRESVKSFLDALPKGVPFGFLGGATGEEVSRKGIAAGLKDAGFSKEDIASILAPSREERDLADRIKDGFDTAIKAQEALIANNITNTDRIVKAIETSSKVFATEFQRNLISADITQTDRTLQDVRSRLSDIGNTNALINQISDALSSQGISDRGQQERVISNIVANRGNIQQVIDLQKEVANFNKVGQSIEKAILAGRVQVNAGGGAGAGPTIPTNLARTSAEGLSGVLTNLGVNLNKINVVDAIDEREFNDIRNQLQGRLGDIANFIFADAASKLTRTDGVISSKDLLEFLVAQLKETQRNAKTQLGTLSDVSGTTASAIGVSRGGLGRLIGDEATRTAIDSLPEDLNFTKLSNEATNLGTQFEQLRARLETLNRSLPAPTPISGFATGGFVNGTGTKDSIPAMLTPGEFVLNRTAVAKIGVNTLNRVNNGTRQKFQNGGLVAGGISTFSLSSDAINAINNFNSNINRLTTSMDNFPREVTMSVTHTVHVIHNGAQVFANMQDNIVKLVEATTNRELTKMMKTKFPELGIL